MSSILRIGIVTPLYDLDGESRSGIAKHCRTLADALSSQGHTVTVIFAPDFYIEAVPSFDRVEPNGVRVICLRADIPRFIVRLVETRPLQHKFLHDLFAIVRVNRCLARIGGSIDAIETTSFGARALGRCLAGVGPSLITRVSTTTDQISAAFQQFYSRAQSLINALERAAILFSPALLTHTKQHARSIEAALGIACGSFAIIQLGIPDMLPPRYSPPPWLPGPTLLFAGQFIQRKAIDVVLAAAPSILEACPNVRLVIAGGPWHSGPVTRDIEALQAAFGERVVTVRDPDDATLRGWIHACDVFTAPSRYESFGLIFVEAMRASKPVIATRVGGIPEVVTDGETGVLVPPGDVDALACACIDLCRDPGQTRIWGEAGRQRFLACFTADEMARRSAALYHRLSTFTVV